MQLTIPKICRELSGIKFVTAHAREVRAGVICHLHTYKHSVQSGAEVDLGALFAACCQLAWLIDHVREIQDKQVKPSERLFLARAFVFVFHTYEQQKRI